MLPSRVCAISFLALCGSCGDGGWFGPDCFDKGAAPKDAPTRETHALILENGLESQPAIARVFGRAASRWGLVGIRFEVVGAIPTDRASSWQSLVVLAGIDPPECAGRSVFFTTFGCGLVERMTFASGQKIYIGRAFLCTKNLLTNNGSPIEDPAAWIETAQHELGHALGLRHHENSIMERSTGNACPDTGFTKQDFASLYRLMLEDRISLGI